MKKIKSILAVKLAALLCACGFAFSAWADAGASLTPSGTEMTPGQFKTAITSVSNGIYDGEGLTVDFSDLTDVSYLVHNSEGPQVYILGDLNSSPTTALTIKNVKFELPSSASYEKMQLYLYARADVTFENCVFYNVSISMNQAVSTVKGIFTNCTFYNVNNYALKYIQNLEATGCLFDSCQRAMLISCKNSRTASSGVKIDGCEFSSIIKDRIIKFYEFITDSNTDVAITGNTVASSTAKFIIVDFDDANTAGNYTYRFAFTGNTGIDTTNLNEGGTEKTLYIDGDYLVDVETSAKVAQIVRNDAVVAKYETLAAAISDAQNGDTIELLSNVVWDGSGAYYNLDVEGSVTIDGKGYTLSAPASGGPSNSAIMLGDSSSSGSSSVYTITNVTFSGFTSISHSVLRAQGVTAKVVDCTFTGNASSGGEWGVVTANNGANVTVKDCVFRGNTGTKCVDVGFNVATGSSLAVDNCLFENNNLTGHGVIYVAGGITAATIRDSSFSGNTVLSPEPDPNDAKPNAAIVYCSGVTDITGCLFTNNTVKAYGKEGVVVLGSTAENASVTGNAFVDNTLSTERNPAHYATLYVSKTCNLSGNYWGDGAAPAEADQQDIYNSGTQTPTIDTYATNYTVVVNGVTVTLYVPPVAEAYDAEGGTLIGQFATVNEAIAAAGATYVKLLDNVTLTAPLTMTNSYTLDFNGKTNYYNTTATTQIKGNSNIIFKNGTLDISGAQMPGTASGNDIFSFNVDGNTLTFDNMELYGDGYGGYSVFWFKGNNTTPVNTLNFVNGSSIVLKDEAYGSGGVFKGPAAYHDNQFFVVNITDSTVSCTNVYRFSLYGTINVKDSTVTFTGGENAFRQGIFTFDHATVTVSGANPNEGRGISPRCSNTVVTNGCVLTFIGSNTGRDVHFEYANNIVIYDTSTVTAASVSSSAADRAIIAPENYILVTTDNDGASVTYSVAPAVAQIGDVKYATFSDAIAAAETYKTEHGEYPTITVLNGATEQDNPDWKIADGKLVKKNYVAQIETPVKYTKLTANITEASDDVYLDIWTYWGMQGMKDAGGNTCPQYVSITDNTMYRDLAVEEGQAEDWVSAKYIYDNYFAPGKSKNNKQTTYLYNGTAASVRMYETLPAALADVQANEKITLLANVAEGGVLPYAATLDKAGFTCGALTAPEHYAVVNFSGNTDLYRTFMDNWERPDYADLSWYTADPSADSFEIATAAQFAGFAQLVNGKAFNADGTPCYAPKYGSYAFRNRTITLTADIDLTAHGWVPVGIDPLTEVNADYTSTYYRGTFDGGNHTITYAFSEQNSIYDYDALFGGLYYTTIKNLKLNVTISYPGDIAEGYWNADIYGGACALASYVANSVVISNVTMNGTATFGTYGSSGGGLVFAASGGAQFYDCVNNATVNIKQYYRQGTDGYFIWGGIACQTTGTSSSPVPCAKFVRCVNNATVTVENPYDNDRLIGRSETGYGSMNRLANMGKTTFYSRKLNAGGIVGQLSNNGYLVHAVDCKNTGTIIGCHTEKFDADGHYASLHQKGSFCGKEYVGGSPTPTDYTIVVSVASNKVFYTNDNTYWFLDVADVDLSACTLKGEGSYYRASNKIYQKVGGAAVQVTDTETIELLNEAKRLIGPVVSNSRVVLQTTPAPSVAQIGETKYETLQAAFEAAQSGDTIELLADVDLGTTGLVIGEDKNFTLDIGEYNITGTVNGKLITNNGTLVINGTTGCVYNQDISGQGHDALLNNGTVTINGGWFGDSDNDKTNANALNRGAGFRNFGTATINGGHFTACDNFTNGGYAYAIINGDGENDPTLTINDADVYGKNNGNLANNSGTITVKGGTYDISGGESYYSLYSYSGNTVVEGGTFTKSGNTRSQFCIEIDKDNTDNPGSIAVSGGSFSAAVPEKYCAEGVLPVSEADPVTDLYTVRAANYVAQIVGGAKFESFAAAVESVQNDDTIVLLSDTTVATGYAKRIGESGYGEGVGANRLVISTDKTFTVDLGGHVLMGRINFARGNMTLINGTVRASSQALNIFGTKDYAYAGQEYSVITVGADATVEANYALCIFAGDPNYTYYPIGFGEVFNVYGKIKANSPVYVSGNVGMDTYVANCGTLADVEALKESTSKGVSELMSLYGPTINIYDGAELIANPSSAASDSSQGVSLSGCAIVNVFGGKITGAEGVGIKGGILNVSGGTITGTGTKCDPVQAVSSGTESSGAAISASTNYNANYPIEINVTGGIIKSVNNAALLVAHSVKSGTPVKAVNGIGASIGGGSFIGGATEEAVIIESALEGEDDLYPEKFISGGYFSTKVPAGYCATGYVPTTRQAANGLYTVTTPATVTYMLDSDAPQGATAPDSFIYPSGDLAEIALKNPTYTSEGYTFGGWQMTIGETTKVVSALPAGTKGDVTLVATWTKATKIEIVIDVPTQEEPQATETVEIKVTDEWVADNVTKGGDTVTTEEIQTALTNTQANGYTGLENYLLGLDGKTATAKVKVDSEQGASETAMPVKNTLAEKVQTADTGFTVKYSLDKVDAQSGETVAGGAGEKQDTSDLELNLKAATSGDSNVAYYKMTATITKTVTKDEETTEVEVSTIHSENTIGVLAVKEAPATAIIGVPWSSSTNSTSISVNDLVRTANLTPGDEMKVYDPTTKTYKMWELNEDKEWEPVSTSSGSGTSGPGQAEYNTVARGAGVWLTRQNPDEPIYLVGQATAEAAATELEEATAENEPAWNLVASPSVEEIDINDIASGEAMQGDTIIVPTKTAPKTYTYDQENGWGYQGVVGQKTYFVPGLGQVTTYETGHVNTDTKLPVGQGFWYLNNTTGAKSLDWSKKEENTSSSGQE